MSGTVLSSPLAPLATVSFVKKHLKEIKEMVFEEKAMDAGRLVHLIQKLDEADALLTGVDEVHHREIIDLKAQMKKRIGLAFDHLQTNLSKTWLDLVEESSEEQRELKEGASRKRLLENCNAPSDCSAPVHLQTNLSKTSQNLVEEPSEEQRGLREGAPRKRLSENCNAPTDCSSAKKRQAIIASAEDGDLIMEADALYLTNIILHEVGVTGDFIRLLNCGNKEESLEGFKLVQTVDDLTIGYKFPPHAKIGPGSTLTVFSAGCSDYKPNSFEMMEKKWNPGPEMVITLSNFQEVRAFNNHYIKGKSVAPKISVHSVEHTESSVFVEAVVVADSTSLPKSTITHVKVDEVDHSGAFIRIINKGEKEENMRGWQVVQKIVGKRPVGFKFPEKINCTIAPGATCTIWSSDNDVEPNPPSTFKMTKKCWDASTEEITVILSKFKEAQIVHVSKLLLNVTSRSQSLGQSKCTVM